MALDSRFSVFQIRRRFADSVCSVKRGPWWSRPCSVQKYGLIDIISIGIRRNVYGNGKQCGDAEGLHRAYRAAEREKEDFEHEIVQGSNEVDLESVAKEKVKTAK
jgi:hypothetical protein